MSELPDAARNLALDVLDAVLGRPPERLEPAFARMADAAALHGRDRAFARLLATTVLRRKGQLDGVLRRYLRYRPKSATAENLLRLGAAQVLLLGTPPHAAVATTVALARGRRRPEAGLLNAVLRRLAADRPALPAAVANLPSWLRQRWTTTYGAAAVQAIASEHAADPPLDLTVPADRAAWAQRLGGVAIGPQTVRLRQAGAVTELPGYEAGAWWVQDVAASLPVAMLGPLNGRRVLDAAAAPGGKTAQLAAAGATVTALDVDGGRLRTVTDNMSRLRLDASMVEADLRTWRPEGGFDVVLLDAPCSATGTIRRHPDIQWHRSSADIARQAMLQTELIDAALAAVKPGGTLMFATCSLEPEEGEMLIADWLERHPEVTPHAVPVTPSAALNLAALGEGQWRSLPSGVSGGMDGFYIAHFRRQG